MKRTESRASIALLCAVFALGAALPARAESADARVDALAARVAALEAQVEALTSELTKLGVSAPVSLRLGEAVTLDEGLTLTFETYRTDTRFAYTPAGGVSAMTLLSKDGYRMLLLTLRLTNASARDLHGQWLLDMTLSAGDDFTAEARPSLFEQTETGAYVGGEKRLTAGTQAQICLLFPIPEKSAESGEALSVAFTYAGQTYTCPLRETAE